MKNAQGPGGQILEGHNQHVDSDFSTSAPSRHRWVRWPPDKANFNNGDLLIAALCGSVTASAIPAPTAEASSLSETSSQPLCDPVFLFAWSCGRTAVVWPCLDLFFWREDPGSKSRSERACFHPRGSVTQTKRKAKRPTGPDSARLGPLWMFHTQSPQVPSELLQRTPPCWRPSQSKGFRSSMSCTGPPKKIEMVSNMFLRESPFLYILG